MPLSDVIPIPPADDATPGWPLRDYVSPGLRVVRPDACFPHMRPGDALHHPWKYVRRDVPHLWYADERYPLMGFLNRDEATLLHNIALQFEGKPALEIGSWLGWSTCHLALAGVVLDVIDPAHEDPAVLQSVEESLSRCGVAGRVRLARGRSPESIAALGRSWSLFFIDGDHEAPAPLRDALACLPYATPDCAFVFHDLASPAVAAGLRTLAGRGFHVVVYQTAQIMGLAWRGNVRPVTHIPDPAVAWQLPLHLQGLPISGAGFEAPAPAAYPLLRDVRFSEASPRPSVCIVSSEIVGPFKNGGVGTAMTGLAELLARDGLRVTILYTGAMWSPDVPLSSWGRHYAALGIELVALTLEDMTQLAGPVHDCGFGVPWLVHRFLAGRHFDVIHFNDCCGEGSLALVAKRLGLAFHDSLLAVALHSPSRWVLELNQILPAGLIFAAFDYAERLSLTCTDLLWSPSAYLLDWVASHGFTIPEQTLVQQYVIPSPQPATRARGRTSAPREIVFFGRLEERKGLRLFCNAIHALREELAQRDITVTFLGKPERCAGMPSLDYIARRAQAWKFPVRTITTLGQPEALAHLQQEGTLAVMASPVDNSPCTVYEALALGVPFLAARTGGIPELVARHDQEQVLFEPTAEGLAHALRRSLEQGAWIAESAVAPEVTRKVWLDTHAHWKTFLAEPGTAGVPERPATVAAVIDHHQGDSIAPTLESLWACPAVQRILILHRGSEPLPIPSIDLLNSDADTLDLEVSRIAEDAVLLLHSGVRIVPEAFGTMLQALTSSGVAGLQPAGRIIGTRRRRVVPPLGGSAAFSLFEGVTYTGALLLRREALMAARQGRMLAVDSPFLGLADDCVAGGAQVWPYPEVVVERGETSRIDGRSSLPARIAAYAGVPEGERYSMLATGYGAMSHGRPTSVRRELALAAVRAGLGPLVRVGSWLRRRLRRETGR